MPHLKVLHTSLEALNIHRGGIFLNSYRDPCDFQIYSLSLQRDNFRNYVEKDYKNSYQSKGRTKSQIVKKDSRWEYKDDFHEGLARVRTSEGKWGYGNNIRLLFTDCNIVDVGYMFDEHIPYVLSFVHRHLSPVGVEGYMLLRKN